MLFSVIPAPHQVRDKLQPVEDSDLSENPVNSICSGCRIKSGMTIWRLFTSSSTLIIVLTLQVIQVFRVQPVESLQVEGEG